MRNFAMFLVVALVVLGMAGCSIDQDYREVDAETHAHFKPLLDKAIDDGYYQDENGDWKPLVDERRDANGEILTSRKDAQQAEHDLLDAWGFRANAGKMPPTNGAGTGN